MEAVLVLRKLAEYQCMNLIYKTLQKILWQILGVNFIDIFVIENETDK